MDVKVGDTVHVRGVVEQHANWQRSGGEIPVRFGRDGCDGFAYVAADNVLSVEPRPLAVGDKVTWGTKATHYTILAIDGEVAWLKHAANTHLTEPLSMLVRA